MKTFGKIVLPIAAAVALTAMPLLSLAAVETLPTGPRSFEDILDILETLLNWMFTILMIVAVMFILWAAYLYLSAGGDPEKVKTASNQLIYAAVAIAVALVSQGIRFIVQQLVQG